MDVIANFSTNSECVELHLLEDGSCGIVFPKHNSHVVLYSFSDLELANDVLAEASLHIIPCYLDERYDWLHVHYNSEGRIRSYFSSLEYWEGFGKLITSLRTEELLNCEKVVDNSDSVG